MSGHRSLADGPQMLEKDGQRRTDYATSVAVNSPAAITEANRMAMKTIAPKNIDEYIAACLPEVQAKLQELRATIRQAAPDAEEAISYQMPTFKLNGNLVHFAAFKNHIGFYPVPTSIEAFKKELSVYKTSKGAVQFPLDQPLPLKLITRIVKLRVKENAARAKAKAKAPRKITRLYAK